jgi:hypothetical protein
LLAFVELSLFLLLLRHGKGGVMDPMLLVCDVHNCCWCDRKKKSAAKEVQRMMSETVDGVAKQIPELAVVNEGQ